MSAITRLNTISRQYSGDTTFPYDRDRGYFFVVMLAGSSGTVEFGGGGGQIPLAEGFHYAPSVAPTSEIIVRATGNFVVHMG